MSAEEASKESSSSEVGITRERIDDTPFWVVGDEKDGYMLTMGKYQLSEREGTQEGAREIIKGRFWEILMKVVALICSDIMKEEGNATREWAEANELGKRLEEKMDKEPPHEDMRNIWR